MTVSGEDKQLVQERRGFEREGGCAWSCVLWFSGSLFGHCAPRRQDSPYVFPREVILTLAAFYTVHVAVTRESADEVVLTAFKRVSLRAHPDKGGSPRALPVAELCQGRLGQGEAGTTQSR